MPFILKNLKTASAYVKSLVKWTAIAMITGVFAGFAGSLFHMAVEWASHTRGSNPFLIYLLPVVGVFITFAYAFFQKYGPLNTDHIMQCINDGGVVSKIMLPLIFVCASISHLVGASVGREGAALQIGGSTGSSIASLFKLDRESKRIATMSGMSAAFAALFGTPVTSVIFVLEVAAVGTVRYSAFFPCVVSAYTAFAINRFLGIGVTQFSLAFSQPDVLVIIRIAVLAVLCALVSVAFCSAIDHAKKLSKKLAPNPYIRAVVCSVLLIVLTLVAGTRDYNGAGMDVVARALSGQARPEAFVLKIVFTALSIAAGFKGGEIVPAFFVGSAFGCVAAPVLGLDPSLGAAVGFVALFCGAVNCPLASLVLALEVFGAQNTMIFAFVCAISYMMSGSGGLYKSQKILFPSSEIK